MSLVLSGGDAEFDWMAANQAALGIKHVIHVGDITENNLATEWQVMKDQVSKLDGKLSCTHFPATTAPLYNRYFFK